MFNKFNSGYLKVLNEMALTWKELPEDVIEKANSILDDYNKTARPVAETKGVYVIDVTGKDQVYYTLWRFRVDPTMPYQPKPMYMGNLKTDLVPSVEEAIRRVPFKTVRIELNTEGTKHHIIGNRRPDLFRFGKYKGETIGEVYLKDPGYIAWLANQKDKGDEYAAQYGDVGPSTEFDQLLRELRDIYYVEMTKKNIESSTSKFVGNVKDRFEGILTIYNVKTSQSQSFSGYGRGSPDTYTSFKMQDDDGNKFYAYNLQDKTKEKLEVGNKIKIVGRIKEHKETLGIKFTKLSYVKSVEKVE